MVLDTSKVEWDLSPLASGDDDPDFAEKRKKVKEANMAFVEKWESRTDWLEDAAVLREALDELEHLAAEVGTGGDEYFYFWLRTHQDQNDPKLKAKYNQIEEFSRDLSNETQFFGLRLAKVSEEKQKEFLADQGLERYLHFLERLFATAKYQLSEAEEKIMTLKASTSCDLWVKMVEGLLVKEEREVLGEDGEEKLRNFSDITSLMRSGKQDVRDSVAVAFHEILEKWVDVATEELNAVLADKKVNDQLRGMERPDEGRMVSDDVEPEVVDGLLDVVEEKGYPLAHKYYALKAKLLGKKQLAYHDRNAAYGKLDKEYSYADTVELVQSMLSEIDGEFVDLLKDFVENGKVDVLPKKGKASGAFSVYVLPTQPSYLLLNHTNTVSDVMTFAHELGHGMNNELIKKKQHSLYFGTPKATAEVASTFFEDAALQGLLKEADDELRLALVMEDLNDLVSSLMRQVACYRFEQSLHQEFRKQGHLSKEEIGELFKKHMGAYMGDAVAQDPGCENWWVYWGHVRMFFYVYSYASGLLISKALQKKVREDPGFIFQVKEFLSSGLSASPKELFSRMGIDITKKEFWEAGLEEVDDLLKEAEELARKLKKI